MHPSEVEAVYHEQRRGGRRSRFGIPDPRVGRADKGGGSNPPPASRRPRSWRSSYTFCRERLAAYKVPQGRWSSSHQLPRDPNGKLYKRQLRDPVLDGPGVGVNEALVAVLLRDEVRSVLRSFREVSTSATGTHQRCYHPDAYDDHGVYRGSPPVLSTTSGPTSLGLAGTLHVVGDPDIERIDEATLKVTSSCLALHWRHAGSGEPHLVMVADYADRFEHRDQSGWKIASRTVVLRLAEDVPAAPEPWRWTQLFAEAPRESS